MLAAELLSLRGDTLEQVRGFFQDNTSVIAQILRYGRQDGTLSYRGDPYPICGCNAFFIGRSPPHFPL
jgi:hypothetical protein